jgi:LPXTG-motif cell wall-anchored protein
MKKLTSYLLILTTLLMLTVTYAVGTTAAAWDGKSIDTSWYNTTDTEFTLTTAAELAGLAAIVNGNATGIDPDDFTGKTIKLGADIDIGGYDWTPIGTRDGSSGAFRGTFDGQGHIISNLSFYVDAARKTMDGAYIGFFGLISGTAMNLHFANAVFINTAPLNSGIIAGRLLAGGKLSHCTVDANSYYESQTNTCGMLVGRSFGTIEYCINYGTLFAYGNPNSSGTGNIIAGGITGLMENDAVTRNCINYGNIIGKVRGHNPNQIGLAGIVAFANNTTVENCVNYGNIILTDKDYTNTVNNGIGGVVGKSHANGTKIKNCYNFGSIEGYSGETTQTGLVLGCASKTVTLENCYSTPCGNLAIHGSKNTTNITIPAGTNIKIVSETDADYATIVAAAQAIEATINTVDVPRVTDGFGNPVVNLKEIATPAVSFASEESHPKCLNDGTFAYWNAAGYTGEDKPWVQYEFPCKLTLRGCVFTWYEDGSGSKEPKSIEIQYWNGSEFVPVNMITDNREKSMYKFSPVDTNILRVVFTPTGTLGGDGKGMPAIAEWDVVGSLAAGTVIPKPQLPSISSLAKPSAAFSYKTDFIFNLNDKTDAYWSAYGYTGTDNPWVQYKLPVEISVSSCVVRWYDDGENIRVPKSIDIQYWDGSQFVSVKKVGTYSYLPNQDNIYKFESVNTKMLRIVITPTGTLGGDGKSMPGIVEWDVMGFLLMEYTQMDLEKAYTASPDKEPATGDATIYAVIAMAVSSVSLAALLLAKRRKQRSQVR